jgi:hypothetical protein
VAPAVFDERRTDDEGLRQPFRACLHRILKVDPPLATVAQQLLEARLALRRGNDQDVLNPRQHQGGQGVVDHRLVVDRQQLLGHRERRGIEAST